MSEPIKGFQEQFTECEAAGMHGLGELQKFKDHPELLPSPFSEGGRKIAELLKENPEFGLKPIMCLRFGGECGSGHPECRKLRGYETGD